MQKTNIVESKMMLTREIMRAVALDLNIMTARPRELIESICRWI